ncbi:MAG TPA: hypothetical protein VND65_03815 [Candidatus Binatia bacterium]|nr:hypothetical protein [Candidatus Binatia bacterium]
MSEQTRSGMQCHEFEILLSEAIDGLLSGEKFEDFHSHAKTCSLCGPLFAEVQAGSHWLKGLTEVEPPASLVNHILASTTGVDTQRLRVNASAAQPQITWWERAQAWASAAIAPIVSPLWGTVRQPRFAMSFGMAFFSLSVALSVLGVKPADLRQLSLRPAAIRHTFYNTEARVVRYYDNIRFVYDLQAAASKLKRNVAPAEPAPDKKEHKNDTTEQPDQKQERNYSQTGNQLILAGAPLGLGNDLPVVSVTTYRRLV